MAGHSVTRPITPVAFNLWQPWLEEHSCLRNQIYQLKYCNDNFLSSTLPSPHFLRPPLPSGLKEIENEVVNYYLDILPHILTHVYRCDAGRQSLV